MAKYKVAVNWISRGEMEIEAETLSDAVVKASFFTFSDLMDEDVNGDMDEKSLKVDTEKTKALNTVNGRVQWVKK